MLLVWKNVGWAALMVCNSPLASAEGLSRTDILGFTNWNALPAELATAHAAIVAGMERSGFKPQVGKEMALADAPRAHEDVLKPGAYGKIVLIP